METLPAAVYFTLKMVLKLKALGIQQRETLSFKDKLNDPHPMLALQTSLKTITMNLHETWP